MSVFACKITTIISPKKHALTQYFKRLNRSKENGEFPFPKFSDQKDFQHLIKVRRENKICNSNENPKKKCFKKLKLKMLLLFTIFAVIKETRLKSKNKIK